MKKKKISIHNTYMDKVGHNIYNIKSEEGRVGVSISYKNIIVLAAICLIMFFILFFKVTYLQIVRGAEYINISDNNKFKKNLVFSVRGNILDRNGEILAWSETSEEDFSKRIYIGEGFSSLLGSVTYPKKDVAGNYFRESVEGQSGVESLFESDLEGVSGSLVSERNALGDVLSELYIQKPRNGNDVQLSIDSILQKSLYDTIAANAKANDYLAGAGALMNIHTGEVLALVSYPDFDNNILLNGTLEEQEEELEKGRGVFVNRSISGLYAPGSSIKPFFGVAAINENIISPDKYIYTTGSISVQNPYDEDITYIYKDNKNHGAVNIYDAIAHSSNVYFYHIGGGYGEIENGLGIDRLKFYSDIFGFGRKTNLGFGSEPEGLIPTPAWKKNLFDEEWTVGDTYNTVIGQYAFQLTPLQLARGISSIANGGYIVEPHLVKNNQSETVKLVVTDTSLDVIRRAMREVVKRGTARSLSNLDIDVAAKTGTSQIGNKGLVNSLLAGFFPYNEPKYAFAVVMERGQKDGVANQVVFSFLNENAENFDF